MQAQESNIGEWTGKNIVVTGGSKGIGLAIVESFLKSSGNVWYLSRTEAASQNELESAAAAAGGKVSWIKTDMSEEASIMEALKVVLVEAGSVDVLVNNAGITRDGLIMRMKTEAWDDVIKVNLTGAFIACRTLARSMAKARKGVIINISSVVGIMGNGGQTNYAASKAGLIGFSKSLAKELASRNIRVNVIAPGFIETQMTEVINDEMKEVLKQQIPLGRIGNPEDIADTVLFLASDKAGYITGQVLAVDGGMVM
ncbi:MAG: 3-oxoacyl-[acyl-carrier-protein] reductase [Bacteroidetes bacterium]|nr:3-oxoacyl-[acyl-carrier-protein] reductase [Bacteroidota bacterium]